MREYTPSEKAEAFAAADRYLDEMEAGPLATEATRGRPRKRNPLFRIFYADGYLEGKRSATAGRTRCARCGGALSADGTCPVAWEEAQ